MKNYLIDNTLPWSITLFHVPSIIGRYLSIYSNLKITDPLASNGNNSLGWIHQGPYLVGVYGIHFGFHGVKPMSLDYIKYIIVEGPWITSMVKFILTTFEEEIAY